LGYISVADTARQYGSNINHREIIGPKATEFGERMQNNSLYTIQDQLRSPLLVPIKSPYATSYYWMILIYILPCTILKILRLLVKFSLCPSLMRSFGVNS